MKKPPARPAKITPRIVSTAAKVKPAALPVKPAPVKKPAPVAVPAAKARTAKPAPVPTKPATIGKLPSPTKPTIATRKSNSSNTPARNASVLLPPRTKPLPTGAYSKSMPAPPPKVPTPKITLAPAFKGTPKADPIISPEKDLTTKHKSGTFKDRLVLMVPDPYWIHAVWEINQQSVLRAESALGSDWHSAKPILRLFDVTSQDTTSTSEAPLRDMVIHAGCTHWWIDVPQPPRSYRADVGYVSRRGQFYMLARSNVVTPPKAGATEVIDEANWAADIQKAGGTDRVLAMSTGFESASGPSQLKEFFNDQFKKPHKDGMFGAGAIPNKMKKFHFELDAELLVRGQTEPNATVTLQNERVPLRPDGSFTMRFSLPDSRQIIPAVSTSADGLEEQTIVLAVERNIKRLDVMTHDMNTEV